MGYILKEDKIYTDKYGVIHTDVYAAIDDVINCKRKKEANVILKIYANKQAATYKKEALSMENAIISNHIETIDDVETEVKDYDTYMTHEVIAANGSEFTKAYAYWNDKHLDTDIWVSDEN